MKTHKSSRLNQHQSNRRFTAAVRRVNLKERHFAVMVKRLMAANANDKTLTNYMVYSLIVETHTQAFLYGRKTAPGSCYAAADDDNRLWRAFINAWRESKNRKG